MLEALNELDAALWATRRPWTITDALDLCELVEQVAPKYGCHVALTGGCLYKQGLRKDCDLVFYRIRQVEKIDHVGLFGALAVLGLNKVGGWGWCHKATFQGKPVDCLFPEETQGPKEGSWGHQCPT